jgi:hypothetical protein
MLMENKMNAAKLKTLKDDETGFNLADHLNEAAGRPNALEEASKESGVELDPDPKPASDEGSESSAESASDEDVDVECKSNNDLYTLGEALGKKCHGDAYKEEIMKDCVDHAIKLSDGDVGVAAAMIRNWYKGANAETTEFSTKLNKFIKHKDDTMKNFSQRIGALKKHFGMTEAAQPKEDINPEVEKAEKEGKPKEETPVDEAVAEPIKTEEHAETEAAPEEVEKEFSEETQGEAVSTTEGTEATTIIEESAATETPVVVAKEATQEVTTVEFSEEEQVAEEAVETTKEVPADEEVVAETGIIPEEVPATCPECGKDPCECEGKVTLEFDKNDLAELIAEAKEFTKYPEQYGSSAEQSVCFGDWLASSRHADYVRDALFSALTK